MDLRNKMVVMAKAAPGRKEELARWYDERHIHDLLAVPGFLTAERHDVIPVKMPEGAPVWDFMLVYEIAGDPMVTLRGMAELQGTDRLPTCDALESTYTLSVVALSRGLRKNEN